MYRIKPINSRIKAINRVQKAARRRHWSNVRMAKMTRMALINSKRTNHEM